jgi:hypothetical protein
LEKFDLSRFRAIYFSLPHSTLRLFMPSPLPPPPPHSSSLPSASPQPFQQPLYHGALPTFFPPDVTLQFILCLCTGERVSSRSIELSGGEVLTRSAASRCPDICCGYCPVLPSSATGYQRGGSSLCCGYAILAGAVSIIEKPVAIIDWQNVCN